ncbi:MAG: PEGA domain-containing protein [Acidobacteria bacterium]|nr:MAG: PEGA domain-containing protein [Acidobacteriota bacterium]
MSELIANRYRIDSTLQDNRSVYQAFDQQLNRTVAIKIWPFSRPDVARAEQFLREATAAARLTHPNVVAVYDVGEHTRGRKAGRSVPFMVMEHVPGHSLRHYLAGNLPLPSEDGSDPFRRKLDLLIHICRGVHYGHEQGLVHGTLTPDNIGVLSAVEVKIFNFGIAPVTGASPVRYLSPEQVAGETIDRRSDVFCLGVLLCEVFFGVHPFHAETEEATRSRIAAGDPWPVRDLLPAWAAGFGEILARSLAPKPDDRFSDCRTLQTALKRVGDQVASESPQPGDSLIRMDDLRKRQEFETLLKEAQAAQAGGDVELASILALQAFQLEPRSSDALELFERTRSALRDKSRTKVAASSGPSSPEASLTAHLTARQLEAGQNESSSGLPAISGNPGEAEESADSLTEPSGYGRAHVLLGLRVLRAFAPVLGLLLFAGGVWFITDRNDRGATPVKASPVAARPAAAPGTVSLDILPWAKVDSIVNLKDGRELPFEELETPCTFSLPAGRYSVTVSHPEFGSRLLRLEVTSGRVTTVQHSLLSERELNKLFSGGS